MRATVVLVSVVAVLFLTWAVGVLSTIVALRRADRARLAIDARAPLIEFRTAFFYSLFWSINLMTFAAVSGWYKLRGKPLPPPPNPWGR